VTTQLQFLLIAAASWMSRHQQAVIEYLQEENRILLEQLGGKPKPFTDAQRIRLARKAKLVGRRRLGKLATLVTPDTPYCQKTPTTRKRNDCEQVCCNAGFDFLAPSITSPRSIERGR
jgi:hypothetical protein